MGGQVLLLPQQGGVAHHRGEGGLQVVGDVGDELHLHPLALHLLGHGGAQALLDPIEVNRGLGQVGALGQLQGLGRRPGAEGGELAGEGDQVPEEDPGPVQQPGQGEEEQQHRHQRPQQCGRPGKAGTVIELAEEHPERQEGQHPHAGRRRRHPGQEPPPQGLGELGAPENPPQAAQSTKQSGNEPVAPGLFIVAQVTDEHIEGGQPQSGRQDKQGQEDQKGLHIAHSPPQFGQGPQGREGQKDEQQQLPLKPDVGGQSGRRPLPGGEGPRRRPSAREELGAQAVFPDLLVVPQVTPRQVEEHGVTNQQDPSHCGGIGAEPPEKAPHEELPEENGREEGPEGLDLEPHPGRPGGDGGSGLPAGLPQRHRQGNAEEGPGPDAEEAPIAVPDVGDHLLHAPDGLPPAVVHRLGGHGQTDGAAVPVSVVPVEITRHVPLVLVGIVAVAVDVHLLPVLEDGHLPVPEGQQEAVALRRTLGQVVVGVGIDDVVVPGPVASGVEEVGVQIRVVPEIVIPPTLKIVEDVVQTAGDLPPEVGRIPVVALEGHLRPQPPGCQPPDGVPRPHAPRQGEIKPQKEDDHTSPFFPSCNQCPTPPSSIPASWD